MLFNELKKGVLLSSVFISLLGLQIPSLYAQSMGDVTFKKQSWVVLPGETRNLSVIDGTLFCYSGGLMLTAPVSSGTIVALMGDTAYSPIDGKMDYVVKHPVSGNIFYTRVDSRGHHTCYEVMPREGKRPKASKIKMNRGISVNHPVFSADGRIMVFSSDQGEGRGGYDLYYSTRNA
ncbi:MAG: PD40 domain-containing protein, partial [Bacteroidales bacterium]|nr:PD40 domain-containing protein [Bacteroidales bacterium]